MRRRRKRPVHDAANVAERAGNTSKTPSSVAPPIADQPKAIKRTGWIEMESVECLIPWSGDDAQRGKR
jgi:hypothetical protein